MSTEFKINTVDPLTSVSLSDYEENVWLTIWLRNGHVNVNITKQEAEKMILALQELVK